jgi:hypothetical protein
MPSFSVCRGLKVFYFQASRWSLNRNRSALTAEPLKDQHMKRIFAVALAFAGAFLTVSTHPAGAAVIEEDFSSDPLQHGWQTAGNAGLFHWDSTNHLLAVTWDSTQPNSFFYHPLDGHLSRYDDFSFEFDLLVRDIASNVEPGKTGPLQIGIGFQNYTVATNANFLRGFGMVSDIAEFCYYPYGYYDWGGFIYESPSTTAPSFISSAPSFSPNTLTPNYVLELPTNVLVHVVMTYTASNQTASVSATTNGVAVGSLPPLALNSTNSNFTASDDYNVNMFSITSYTSIGDDFDSVLAHGTVANLKVTLPPPAQNLALAFTNSQWQVRFDNKTNWVYTLQKTADFISWTNVSGPLAGNGTSLTLHDDTAATPAAFYRVQAHRP